MTGMIDRVAQQMAAAEFDPALWETSEEWFRDIWRARARTAIGAMREPQVEMIAAFWRQKNCGTQEIGQTGSEAHDYAAWRAAIDAALNEKEQG